MMIGIQVTDEQLECITDRTIQEADRDGDEALSFEEFAKVQSSQGLGELQGGGQSGQAAIPLKYMAGGTRRKL